MTQRHLLSITVDQRQSGMMFMNQLQLLFIVIMILYQYIKSYCLKHLSNAVIFQLNWLPVTDFRYLIKGRQTNWNEVFCQNFQKLLIINSMGNILPVSNYHIPPSLDPVTDMNLDNVKHVYSPGEVITCAAEGNPEPEIRWVDDANATIFDSAFILVQPFMEGTQTYSCLATNDVRGVTYSLMETVTFKVTSKNNFSNFPEPFFLRSTHFNSRLTDELYFNIKY